MHAASSSLCKARAKAEVTTTLPDAQQALATCLWGTP